MSFVTVRQAATRLGVGYSTLKQWIYQGSVRTTRTRGGHHRIAAAEVERLLADAGRLPDRKRPESLSGPPTIVALSTRNQLRGIVEEVRTDGLLAKGRLGAAAAGQLRTREQVAQHSNRLLGDPRSRAKVQYFLHHWLQMDHVENLSKDDKLYPGFTPEIIADLRTSLDVFLDDAVWNGSSDYRQLLLADYLYVNDRLSKKSAKGKTFFRK
jgi:excisionase family DNA binding protein